MSLRGLEVKVRSRVWEHFVRELVAQFLNTARQGSVMPNPVTEIVEPLRAAGYASAGLSYALLLIRDAGGGVRVKRSIVFGDRGQILGVEHTRSKASQEKRELPSEDELVNAILRSQ